MSFFRISVFFRSTAKQITNTFKNPDIRSVHSHSVSLLFAHPYRRVFVINSLREHAVDKIRLKMNHFNLQQNAFESRDFVFHVSCVPIDSLACPKPRRVGILSSNLILPFRLLHSSQSGAADVCDSKAGADLLDIFRRKEETLSGIVSSHPFFLVSPPCRVSNLLTQDARFGDDELNPVSPSLLPLIPSPSRVKGGGCGRVKFGIKPASVRVKGFDCLNRNRQNSSIPTMA